MRETASRAIGSGPAFRRRAGGVLMACVLAGCTVLRPVPAPSPPGLFGSEVKFKRPEGALATEEAAPCDGVQWDEELCVRPAIGDLYAPVASAIFRADQRQLYWRRLAGSGINTNTTFNGLLWPAGAVALYQAATRTGEGAGRAMLRLSLAGAAAYGLLSSGIPERNKFYLEASRKLSCEILSKSIYVYWDSEVEAMRVAEVQLRRAIGEFKHQRLLLLASIRPRSTSTGGGGGGKTSNDQIQELVRKYRPGAPAGGGGGLSVGNPVEAIERHTAERLKDAEAALDELRTLLQNIEGAGLLLHQASEAIESELAQRLEEKAPPPLQPADVVARLAAMESSLKDAFASRAKAESATGKEQQASSPPMMLRLLDRLDKPSGGAWQGFEAGVGKNLDERVSRAEKFTTDHAKRYDAVRQQASSTPALSCTPRPAEAPAPLSDARGNAQGRGNTSATPAAGTPLPGARSGS